MRGAGALRTFAVIEAATETETSAGGRPRTWSAVGRLWMAWGVRALRERAPAAPGVARDTVAAARVQESATAEARDHPEAQRGRRLAVDGGGAWRIAAVERDNPVPGRMRLHLIKD